MPLVQDVRHFLTRCRQAFDQLVALLGIIGAGLVVHQQMPGMLAIVIDQAVAGDAEEPGRKARQRLVLAARIDHLQPDILVQLIGQRRVTALPRQIAVKRAAVATIEQCEGIGITCAVGQHQSLVTPVRLHGGSLAAAPTNASRHGGRQRGRCGRC
ncbi:MAG: hypothetical protein AW07_03843 [Candidatus Accumulibacter sp. SK-11]|nr:MAG: hypothetical protein AW07_03843 [Candidatus Accumulibacter sp. SK-11]